MGTESFFSGLLGGVSDSLLTNEKRKYEQKLLDNETRTKLLGALIESGQLQPEEQAIAMKALSMPSLQSPTVLSNFTGKVKGAVTGRKPSQSQQPDPAAVANNLFDSFAFKRTQQPQSGATPPVPTPQTGQEAATPLTPVPQPKTMAQLKLESVNQAEIAKQQSIRQQQHTELEQALASAGVQKGTPQYLAGMFGIKVNPDKPETLDQVKADLLDRKLSGKMTQAQYDSAIVDVQAMYDAGTKPKTENRDDKAIAIMAKPEATWAPEERAYMKGYKGYVDMNKIQPAVVRMQALMATPYNVIDSQGNLVMATRQMIKDNPGEYASGTTSMTVRNRQALFNEIDATREVVNDAIGKLGPQAFDATQRAQAAMVLKSTDPRSAWSSFLQSSVAKTLSPEQINYITGLVSLQESAMSLRSIGGMGQGSDQLRAAITKMLPGPETPSLEYAKRQMNLFNVEVNALRKTLPKVPGSTLTNIPEVRTSVGGIPPGATMKVPGSDGKMHWSDGKSDLGVVQ